MDPLSITASITAILQVTGAIISYLRDVQDAPGDRIDLAIEVSGLKSLLTPLCTRVREAKSEDPWVTAVLNLGVKNGPLDQIRSALERLELKLCPVEGFKKLGKRLTWMFDKTEILNILSKIDRIKTLVTLALANDLCTLSREIKGDVSEIRMTVAEIRVTQSDKEHRDIADWLSPINFKVKQSEVFQKREDGTGQWLLKSRDLEDWLVGTSEILWCPGIPGAGKTILASIVINYLQTVFKDNNVAIACIYCNYKEQATQTVPNLLACLLKQLVQGRSAISGHVRSLYKRHIKEHTCPTLGELLEALHLEIRTYSKVFIVVDALDECPEDNGTRAGLVTELRSLPGTVNLMVTSRDLTSIARVFLGAKRLDIRANTQDLRRYIQGRISREPRLAGHVKGDPTLQDYIVKKVLENVRGMFLLARLHMDSLATKSSRKRVREALDRLPKEVDETYKQAIQRIEGQCEDDWKLAKGVFSWITYARRPLSVKELQHALAVTSQMSEMDLDAIVDADILTSVCAGLVVIDEETSIIHLVHYTTQEYFECNRDYLFPVSQANIAATCLTYLSFDVFRRGYCCDDQELKLFLEENGLLDYAARYWGDHSRGQAEENCKEMALRFLRDDSSIACASQILMIPSIGNSQWFPKDFSGLHVSSFFGLEQTAKSQIENGAKADLKDTYGRTPLSWATENGHEAVVALLLVQHGVGVNLKDTGGRTPLLWAVKNGHEAVVVKLLAQKDVDVNSKDAEEKTPLLWAALAGHKAVVALLLAQEGIEVNSKDSNGQTPLSWAAKNGHETVVTLLARNEVGMNVRDHMDGTPLSWAVLQGHAMVVALLLARDDVKVNSKDIYGRAPLSWAAKKGNEAMVKQFLIRADVEVNSQDKHGRTPLSWAAENGHESVIVLMLACDNVQDKYGRTPLSCACENGHKLVVALVLARDDVEVNLKDTGGRTPLLWAVRNEHRAVIALLQARNDIEVIPSD